MLMYILSYLKCFFVYNLSNNAVYTLVKGLNFNYDEERLNYISKNISKSLILIYICIYGYKKVIDALCYNVWDNDFIYQLGILYSSHDILSLFNYYNILSSTTKLHHFSVLILSIANLNIDYTKGTIWRGLIAYAFFSALAFYVNTFLGARFLIKKKKYLFNFKSSIFSLLNILCR